MRQDVIAEGAPHLEVKAIFSPAPQDDFGFPVHRARAHVDWKGIQRQIEGALGIQQQGSVRPAHFEGQLALADVHTRSACPASAASRPVSSC